LLKTPQVEPSAAWWEAWTGFELELLAEGKSPSVLKNRRSAVLIMARNATAAGREPGTITKQQMQSYLLAQFKGRRGQGATTLHNDLRSFWRWYSAEYGTPDPMAGIKAPKGKAAVPPVLDPADLVKVFKACEGRSPWETARNLAIVWLMLESGLRRAEVSALDLADIDLKARTVTVLRGKGGKARVAVFGDSTAKALWRWLQKRGREDGPLFLGTWGGRLSPGGLSELVARIRDRSGVQVRPHMLRHAWAHHSLAAGMRDSDLMKLAGWSSATMLTRYGAALAQERAIAAGRQIQVGRIMKARQAGGEQT
jgi:integrase